jgi:hypothetical protein
MKSFFAILLSGIAIGSIVVACSSSTPTPIVNTTPTVTTPTGLDAGLESGACGNFATENEQLLNAPTDSVAIKKTVNLPQ